MAYVPQAAVREADRLLSASVLAFLLALGLLLLGARPAGVAGELELAAARACLADGSLALETQQVAGIARGAELEQGARLLVVASDGRRLLAPPLGRLASALPLVALGDALERLAGRVRPGQLGQLGALGLALRDVLALALLGMVFTAAARRVGASRQAAWLGALGLGATTCLWPQAQAALGDVLASLLLFLALHLVLAVRESYERLRPPRAGVLVGLGAALSGSFLVRPDLVLAAGVLLGAALIVIQRGRRRLLSGRSGPRRARETFRFAAPLVLVLPLLALALATWIDRLRCGSALAGFRAALLPGAQEGLLPASLLSMLVSPGNGLAWMAPGLVLVPFGLWAAWRDDERLWPLLCLVLTPLFVLVATRAGELAPDESFGPVSLVPLVPILWLGLPLALDLGAHAPLLRSLGACALALGLVVALPGVLVSGGAYRALALSAASEVYPPSLSGEPLWRALHDDWSFASPWVRWRILRHRLSGPRDAQGRTLEGDELELEDETFPRQELFHHAGAADGFHGGPLVVPSLRDREFAHLAWIVLARERGVPTWPAATLVLACLFLGLSLRRSGLDPGRD